MPQSQDESACIALRTVHRTSRRALVKDLPPSGNPARAVRRPVVDQKRLTQMLQVQLVVPIDLDNPFHQGVETRQCPGGLLDVIGRPIEAPCYPTEEIRR